VLDLIRFLFGDADQVTAQGGFRTGKRSQTNTAEDTVCLQFATRAGILVSHCHCWGSDRWLDEMEVTGSDFSLVVDLNHQKLSGIDRGEEVFLEHPVNGFAAEQRAWLDAIRTGDRTSIRSTYADATRSLSLCLAVNRSVESGLPERVRSLED
jgi:predicted dehydrogenase